MEHQRTEVVYHGDRVHPLPEQVRGVQLDADVGRAGALDELAHIGRVEHDVLRVQLERHLHVEVGRLAVDLPPELRGDAPLVVEHVEGGRVPGVDDPVRPPATRFAGRQAGHRHDAVLAQTIARAGCSGVCPRRASNRSPDRGAAGCRCSSGLRSPRRCPRTVRGSRLARRRRRGCRRRWGCAPAAGSRPS